MKDRYLFKAKCFEEWYIGNIVKEPDGLYIRDIKENVMAYIDDESTICQCTGLKDKNGNLIWENDIVRYTDMITRVDKIDCIKWNETHASFVRLHRSQMGLQYLNIDELIANGFDVVGNIFDNPGLLESEE